MRIAVGLRRVRTPTEATASPSQDAESELLELSSHPLLPPLSRSSPSQPLLESELSSHPLLPPLSRSSPSQPLLELESSQPLSSSLQSSSPSSQSSPSHPEDASGSGSGATWTVLSQPEPL